MKMLHMLAFVLLLAGGLNWLLVGLFQWEIGMFFGGQDAVISRIIYLLVGASAVYLFATHKSMCMMCKGESMGMKEGMSMQHKSGMM